MRQVVVGSGESYCWMCSFGRGGSDDSRSDMRELLLPLLSLDTTESFLPCRRNLGLFSTGMVDSDNGEAAVVLCFNLTACLR